MTRREEMELERDTEIRKIEDEYASDNKLLDRCIHLIIEEKLRRYDAYRDKLLTINNIYKVEIAGLVDKK